MTPEKLRDIYGETSPRAAVKVISKIDKHVRAFIEASPFIVLATSDGDKLDASPKGDPAGFVQVEDETHILLPDRPGNNRLDGLLNILKYPKVAMIFLIPTVGETMRINGHATIHDDADLCARFAVKGRKPKTVTRVRVEEVFSHCGKAPLRGGLWKPETWPQTRPVASLYEIVRDHGEIETPDLSEAEITKLYEETLY